MDTTPSGGWWANLRQRRWMPGPAAIILTALVLMGQTAFYSKLRLNNACTIQTGSGAPESAVVGSVCDLYLRTNGGSATTLYVKESGSGNTGWAAAGSGAGGGGTVVRKTADESVTSSTTLQDDNHLTFAIAASQVATTRFILFVDAGTTGDLKLGLSVPSGASYTCGSGHVSNSTASSIAVQATSSTTVTVGGLGGGTVYEYVLDCTVVNSTTAGNVVLQWAQNTSDGTATTLKTNSVVIVGSPSALTANGGLVLIEQHTASSSASLDFTTCFTSTYDQYLIEFRNLVPATDNVASRLRLSTDGGSSYDSSAIYDYSMFYVAPSFGPTNGSGTNATAWVNVGNIDNAANLGLTGFLHVFEPLSTVSYKRATGQISFGHDSIGFIAWTMAFKYRSTTAVNAFQFTFDSGNIATGAIQCFGMAK